MVYKWNAAWNLNSKPDAQMVGKKLEQLKTEHNDILIPSDIVDDARSKKSILHPIFEWDNNIAAELHRKEQARALMRCLVVVYDQDQCNEGKSEDGKKMVRAFIHIDRSDKDKDQKKSGSLSDPKSGYYGIEQIIDEADLRKKMIAQALSELISWQNKYRLYKELAELHSCIDNKRNLIIYDLSLDIGGVPQVNGMTD